MAVSSKRPLSRDLALSCVTLNFSLSGLGSLKAGQYFTGVMQLATAFAGFFLCLAWIFKWIYRIYQAQVDEPLSPPPAAWLGEAGIGGFVISYLWMLWTCASLMREAKANEKEILQNPPPKLDDLGKPPKLGK